jgi:probable rRNA maturation factor
MVTLEFTAKRLSIRALQRFLRAAQRATRVAGEVGVLITGNGRMQALNREFRGQNKPTDVLSFPAVAVNNKLGGDIAISAEIAAQNALLYGHSLEKEIRVLMLHGMLHLAGYDHERDNGLMARREQRLRRQFHLPLTLTERTRNGARPRASRRTK